MSNHTKSTSKPPFKKKLAIKLAKKDDTVEVAVFYGGTRLTDGALVLGPEAKSLQIVVGGEFNDAGDPSISPRKRP